MKGLGAAARFTMAPLSRSARTGQPTVIGWPVGVGHVGERSVDEAVVGREGQVNGEPDGGKRIGHLAGLDRTQHRGRQVQRELQLVRHTLDRVHAAAHDTADQDVVPECGLGGAHAIRIAPGPEG